MKWENEAAEPPLTIPDDEPEANHRLRNPRRMSPRRIYLRLSNRNRGGERLRENTALPSALALRPASDFKRRARRLSSLSPLRVSLPVPPSSPALAIVSPIEP